MLSLRDRGPRLLSHQRAACLSPLASFMRWRGRSKTGPFHARILSRHAWCSLLQRSASPAS